MPTGIFVNPAAVVAGGLLGGFLKSHIPERVKKNLPFVFGFTSILLAITLMMKVASLSAVALSLVLGTLCGELLQLEDRLTVVAGKVQSLFGTRSTYSDEHMGLFTTVLILFCASGTGIFGAMNEGFTGDASILVVKSILDFFTAMIFAATLGYFITIISIPQLILYVMLYVGAELFVPLLTPAMIADFSTVGGIITLAAGFRILNIIKVKVINFLPAFLFILPISCWWCYFFG